MGLQSNNNYLNSIRNHLKRKKYVSTLSAKPSPPSSIDPDLREDLKLVHTSSHEDSISGYTDNQSWAYTSPSAIQSSATLSRPESSSSNKGLHNKRSIGSFPVVRYNIPKRQPRCMYPDGTSCLIKRGTLRGHLDRRHILCAFRSTSSLSHCTFRRCYCMRAPLVSSPLKNCLNFEDLVVTGNDDENSIDQESQDISRLSGKIRLISWTKSKTLMDPIPDQHMKILDGCVISSPKGVSGHRSTSPSRKSSIHQRTKRYSIQDNLKRMVSYTQHIESDSIPDAKTNGEIQSKEIYVVTYPSTSRLNS